jgi:hypothetical protein
VEETKVALRELGLGDDLKTEYWSFGIVHSES